MIWSLILVNLLTIIQVDNFFLITTLVEMLASSSMDPMLLMETMQNQENQMKDTITQTLLENGQTNLLLQLLSERILKRIISILM